MKQIYRIDSNGFYIEPIIIEDDKILTNNLINIEPPQLYKAKWMGDKWIEGATLEEINEINTPKVVLL